MLEKRLKIILAFIIFCFTALVLRLLYLQAVDSENLAKAATAQRTASSWIEKPRGRILDRNGIPFTGRETRYTVVLKPLYLRGKNDDISAVCRVLGLDYEKTVSEINGKSQVILVETGKAAKDFLLSLNIGGISVVYSRERYSSGSLAAHVIGYLKRSDQVGQSGIEKFYESQLGERGLNTIGVITDAKNNLLSGLGYRINRADTSGELNVRLTLDYHIQKIVEAVMDKEKIKGAVVVEDVKSGDILAMASKPDFDRNKVESYLGSSGNELFNRATAAYNIGSVFKIVDAAVFLKPENLLTGYYTCTGSIRIGKNEFKCTSYSKGGHGELNLGQAFAQSCNTWFIHMALKAGYRQLVEEAAAFGLGSYTGIREQGVSEYKGNLPVLDRYYSEGDIANISIGQGEIMATPVQVCNLVAVIANDGIRNRMNIVDCLEDGQGKKAKDLRVKAGERVISREDAAVIRKMMEAVTDDGTGTAARLAEYGGGAGKTGSAETGSKEVVHAWFAGYFPRNEPRYAMTVFIENGQYGGKAAAPIFAAIAEGMSKGGF